MIVRCPECQTGFNLPLDKVGQKGAKVRCSKCNHVFRVRLGFDGRAEIFYNASSSADPPTKELSEDLFQEDFGKTQLGGPITTEAPDAATDIFSGRANSTSIGFGGAAHKRETQPTPVARPKTAKSVPVPKIDDNAQTSISAKPTSRRAEVSKTDFNPFPHAGQKKQVAKRPSILTPTPRRELKAPSITPPPLEQRTTAPPVGLTPPPKANDSGFGIDLFDDDESGFGAREPSMGDDPFAGAFRDESTDDLLGALGVDSLSAISSGSLSLSDSQPLGVELVGGSGPGWEPPDEPSVSIQQEEVVPSDDFFFQQRETEFGAADDLVDPNFGKDVPSLDAQHGLVEPSSVVAKQPQKSKRRTNAAPDIAPELKLKSPPKHPNAKRGARPAPAVSEPTATSSMITRAALQPHRIGGTSAQRIVNTLFIVVVTINAFVLLIAGLSEWKYDFSRPLYMLEVAFEGQPFDQSNNAVVPTPATNSAAESQTPIAEGVEAEVGKKQKQHLLIVRGVLKNPNAAVTPVPDMLVKVTIDGEASDAPAIVGSDTSIEDYDPDQDRPASVTQMEPNATLPFHAVFPLDKAPKVYSFSISP